MGGHIGRGGLWLSIAALVVGCTAVGPGRGAGRSPTPDDVQASATMPGTGLGRVAYLDGLIALLETLHPDGDRIDWDQRRDALDVAGVDSTSDVYRAAASLVAALDDPHSRFVDAPGRARQESSVPTEDAPLPSAEASSGDLAHLRLPSTVALGDRRDRYIGEAWTVLTAHAGACGWIIDLRGNSGGDAWLMLQGIAPLLGEGTVLRADPRDGPPDIYAVADDVLLVNDAPLVGLGDEVPLPPQAEPLVSGISDLQHLERYRVPQEAVPGTVDGDVPVAVLHDAGTASAAEITVVALRGRPGPYRTFGEPTAGFPTGVTGFLLVDGSKLRLTTHLFSDRDGTRYRDALEPDVPTRAPVDDAAAWLRQQDSC